MRSRRLSQTTQTCLVAGLLIIWWSCAVAVTVVIRSVIRSSPGSNFGNFHFPFPLTLTCLSNFGSAAIMGVVSSVLDMPRRFKAPTDESLLESDDSPGGTPSHLQLGTYWSDRFVLVLMGILQGFSMGAKNEALMHISISMRTMIFSTNVLVVMLAARLFRLETFTPKKLVSLLILTLGSALQGGSFLNRYAGDVINASALFGIFLALTSLFLDALRWVFLQILFSRGAHIRESILKSPLSPRVIRKAIGTPIKSDRPTSLSKVNMAAWVQWSSCPIFVLLAAHYEQGSWQQASNNPLALGVVATGLAVGCAGINLSEFAIVQHTSALSFNVMSDLHKIPMVIAGIACFGDEVKTAEVAGFGMCIIAAMLFSSAKHGDRIQR